MRQNYVPDDGKRWAKQIIQCVTASGHLQTFAAGQAVSARPLEADIVSLDGHVGFGSGADIQPSPMLGSLYP